MIASTTQNNAGQTADTAHDAAHTLKGELRHALHVVNDASRKVRSAINNAGDEISYVSEKATGEIRNNPVRSSILALGAGIVLGMIIRRI